MKKEKYIVIYPVSYSGLSRVLVRFGSEVIDEELTQDLCGTLRRFKKLYKIRDVVSLC